MDFPENKQLFHFDGQRKRESLCSRKLVGHVRRTKVGGPTKMLHRKSKSTPMLAATKDDDMKMRLKRKSAGTPIFDHGHTTFDGPEKSLKQVEIFENWYRNRNILIPASTSYKRRSTQKFASDEPVSLSTAHRSVKSALRDEDKEEIPGRSPYFPPKLETEDDEQDAVRKASVVTGAESERKLDKKSGAFRNAFDSDSGSSVCQLTKPRKHLTNREIFEKYYGRKPSLQNKPPSGSSTVPGSVTNRRSAQKCPVLNSKYKLPTPVQIVSPATIKREIQKHSFMIRSTYHRNNKTKSNEKTGSKKPSNERKSTKPKSGGNTRKQKAILEYSLGQALYCFPRPELLSTVSYPGNLKENSKADEKENRLKVEESASERKCSKGNGPRVRRNSFAAGSVHTSGESRVSNLDKLVSELKKKKIPSGERSIVSKTQSARLSDKDVLVASNVQATDAISQSSPDGQEVCSARLQKYYDAEKERLCKEAEGKEGLDGKSKYEGMSEEEVCEAVFKKRGIKKTNYENFEPKGGGGGGSSKQAEDDHEHPCVCDVRKPRKPLSKKKIHEMYKSACQEGGGGGAGGKKNKRGGKSAEEEMMEQCEAFGEKEEDKEKGKTNLNPAAAKVPGSREMVASINVKGLVSPPSSPQRRSERVGGNAQTVANQAEDSKAYCRGLLKEAGYKRVSSEEEDKRPRQLYQQDSRSDWVASVYSPNSNTLEHWEESKEGNKGVEEWTDDESISEDIVRNVMRGKVEVRELDVPKPDSKQIRRKVTKSKNRDVRTTTTINRSPYNVKNREKLIIARKARDKQDIKEAFEKFGVGKVNPSRCLYCKMVDVEKSSDRKPTWKAYGSKIMIRRIESDQKKDGDCGTGRRKKIRKNAGCCGGKNNSEGRGGENCEEEEESEENVIKKICESSEVHVRQNVEQCKAETTCGETSTTEAPCETTTTCETTTPACEITTEAPVCSPAKSEKIFNAVAAHYGQYNRLKGHINYKKAPIIPVKNTKSYCLRMKTARFRSCKTFDRMKAFFEDGRDSGGCGSDGEMPSSPRGSTEIVHTCEQGKDDAGSEKSWTTVESAELKGDLKIGRSDQEERQCVSKKLLGRAKERGKKRRLAAKVMDKHKYALALKRIWKEQLCARHLAGLLGGKLKTPQKKITPFKE